MKAEEGSRITPKFGMSATEEAKVPFTVMGNTRKGIQLGRNIKNLFWHMLILTCLLDIQTEVLNGQYVWGKAG